MSTPVMDPFSLEIHVTRWADDGMRLMRNSYVVGVIGAGILTASFFVTLWLTEPVTPPSIQSAPPNKGAEILAAYLVPDEGILSSAARAAGFQASDKLAGYVEGVARLNKDQVKISGWAADTTGQGTPITI